MLNLLKSYGFIYQSNYDKALEYRNKTLKLAELLGLNNHLGSTFFLMAIIYNNKGDSDKTIKYLFQALTIWEKAKNLLQISHTHSYIGVKFSNMGEYDQSIKHSERSISINESSDFTLIGSYNTLGRIFTQKGELKQGLNYLKKAHDFGKKSPDKLWVAMNLTSIGINLKLQGDFNESIRFFEQNIEITEGLGNTIVTGVALFELLTIYLEKGDDKKTQFYLDRLKQSVGQKEDLYTNPYPILGKVLVLKNSKRISDIGEAEKILKEFIKTDQIISELIYMV